MPDAYFDPRRHLLLDGVIQILRLQFAKGEARRLKVPGEQLGQTLVERGVFHVDHHAADVSQLRSVSAKR